MIAAILIYIFKFFFLLKKLAGFILLCVVLGVGRFILRPLFHKVAVRLYYYYIIILKKSGWHKLKNNFPGCFLRQKMTHLLVVGISILLLFFNLAQKTRADDLYGGARNIILMDLVRGEFGELDPEEERLIVELFDREAVISATQQSYFDNLSIVRARPQATAGKVPEETDEEDPAATTRDGSSIVRPDLAETKITRRLRPETITYVVESGDTVSSIAEKFEISVNTILWENGLNDRSIIRPGDKLAVLPMSGINHEVAKGETLDGIAKKYGAEKEKILEFNDLEEDAVLQAGRALLIPGGKKAAPAYVPPARTGLSAIRNLAGAPAAKPAESGKMNWPADGGRITQYYSWRHLAVDIANKTGTPIYAADAGTIEYIGWGTGYGNQIVIDHGGGKKTRYAHLSKFFVEKGQTVSKGGAIGAMGSTGWSTGPHLHFEVIINNVKQNPLNYIK